jgi:hypothetical protein
MSKQFQPLINYFEKIAVLDESEKQWVKDLFVFKSYKSSG